MLSKIPMGRFGTPQGGGRNGGLAVHRRLLILHPAQCSICRAAIDLLNKKQQGKKQMKLVRYGNPGKEKPGLIDLDGKLRDLSSVVPDIGPTQLGSVGLARIRKTNPAKLPLVRGTPRFGCPVAQVGKFSRHRPELRGPCRRVGRARSRRSRWCS
jgi:hypothetical protein